MESKPLSSLYLCGDESDENAFGRISSFDNMDLGVAIPDNVAYENLPNHHNMGTVSEASGNSYLSNGSGDEILSNNVGAGLTLSSTSLSADDANAFTSRSNSFCPENNSNSLLTELADSSLPTEKISNSELINIIKNTEMIKTRMTSAEDGFTDSGLSDMFSSVTSNLNCSDQNLTEVSCSNMTSYDHSLIGKKQGNGEHSNGAVLDDLNECSGDDDADNDEADDYCDRLPSEDWPDNEDKEFNEDGEDVEDEEDDETDEEEEEEEDHEDTPNDENFPELLGDGKVDLDVTEKPELTDDVGCDPGSSLLPVPEAPVIKAELEDASVTDDVKERPKKARKRKRKPDSEAAKDGKEKPKRKRKRKNKDGSKSTQQSSEFGNIRRSTFERKNIRKIIDDNLDEETKTAQKEEMERKQRLLEIQEKLRQQALELRAQREKEALNNSNMEKLKNSALKSLLEEKAESPSSGIGDLMRSHGTMVPGPQKAPDVVEISSSDEEEDNDIIMMSEEEEEEEEDEDLESSGSHVNDALNRADAQGFVLVNVGHPAEDPDIFLAPQLASIVKPHQIGGIRFLYDNVVESLDRYKTSNGLGCILAHSMGLGKTIQVIAFIDIFLRHTGARSILIIVPVNTLQNWINEFNMWLPTVEEENRASIDSEILWPRDFKLYVVNDNMKLTTARAKVVADWHQTGGVLLLGYEMYRLLIKTKGVVTKPKRSAKKASAEPLVIDVEEEEFNKELVKGLHEALMKPGPDLVICDEGHRIKNSHASISQVLKNIRTRRRVVLTGYPLQNNLLEYWCMVDFVRPNYLGTKTEFCNMFERPIMNGQCVDSTPSDVKLMRFRAHVLHSLLEGFVQRRGHAVLQAALPVKEEYVVFIRMSAIQRQLYNEFMSSIKDSGLNSWSNSNNPIKAFSVCCKIWNHPDILYQIVEQRKDDNDLDIEDTKAATDILSTPTAPGKAKGKGRQKQSVGNSATQPPAMVQAPGPTQAPDLTQISDTLDPIQFSGSGQMPGMIQTPSLSLLPGLIQAAGSAVMPAPTQIPGLTHTPGQQNGQSLSATAGMLGIPAPVIPTVPSSLTSATTSSAVADSGAAVATTETGATGPVALDAEATKATVAPVVFDRKESQVISYDWATNLMKDYVAGIMEHSGKMVILIDIIEESVTVGDKILVFSLIEEYLGKRNIPGTEETWIRNRNYFRLDGSTSGIDREKLINQFNDDNNDKIHLFLLSTRAGCLGINLVGASRVVIFDASWNPCHDCQAVCRVYRYGQSKSCYVYRLVTDNTMEKNIYDRQINKQGISDRVVDELNPQNMLSRKQVDILMRYEDAELPTIEAKDYGSSCSDSLLGKIVTRHHSWITKEPFTHESLLLDRKDQKLTKHEKRLAKQGYEMEKKMSSFGLGRPGSYQAFYQKNADGIPIMRYGTTGGRPVASVRPMMSTPIPMNRSAGSFQTRFLGQNFGNAGMKPGVSVQQVQTTTDIIIPPTNTTSDSAPSKIPAGEKVLIIKTPKGVYIRTSHGKIFAVRTASKTGTTSAPSTTTITSTTSQAIRKATPSTATRLTSTTVGFVSTVTGSTATNSQSAVKSMTSSTGAPTISLSNSESTTSLVASASSAAAAATTVPIPSATIQKSVFETMAPVALQTADGLLKSVPQLNKQPGPASQPTHVPVVPAIVSAAANTKAGATSSSGISALMSATGGKAAGGFGFGGGAQVNSGVVGITPNVSNFGSLPAHLSASKSAEHGMSVAMPAEDRPDHEPMWDRAPGFDDLLSDSDDLNASSSMAHSSLDHHQQQQQSAQQQTSSADSSHYHGFLGAASRSPPSSTMVPNMNEIQPFGLRPSSSSKSFVPVDHRSSQSVPPRHPMPMPPTYLTPAMGPYGMPGPYPWGMPSMPPMWMQPMGPMGRMGMDAFPDAFNPSDATDFGGEMNFDDLASDDRSFSSLLLGSDSDDILGRRNAKGGLDGARTSGSTYRQSTSMPYSSGMGAYPYHPYPYNMPQGGYYPPPHPSPSPSSQGSSTSMNRGYIPMHYPTPMPATHMGMHPGYMPPPGMMPTYDMSAASSGGRSLSGKKNEFDLKDN